MGWKKTGFNWKGRRQCSMKFCYFVLDFDAHSEARLIISRNRSFSAYLSIITVRIRIFREGNVFSPVHLSFCLSTGGESSHTFFTCKPWSWPWPQLQHGPFCPSPNTWDPPPPSYVEICSLGDPLPGHLRLAIDRKAILSESTLYSVGGTQFTCRRYVHMKKRLK